MLMINKNSPVPIYYQLEEIIRQQIDDGTLMSGKAIPSEREYAELYQISRMTVRQAINKLVNEGLLYRKKGTGTFVQPKKVEQVFQKLTSFSEDMIERGLVPKSKVLTFEHVPVNDLIAKSLKLENNSTVLKIVRIRYADDSPMAIETSYMPADLMKDLLPEQAEESIYEFIEKNLQLKIQTAYQELEATIADEKLANLLNISEGDPVLLINRITYTSDGIPFEFCQSSFCVYRYRFINYLTR